MCDEAWLGVETRVVAFVLAKEVLWGVGVRGGAGCVRAGWEGGGVRVLGGGGRGLIGGMGGGGHAGFSGCVEGWD